jgi:hypothetical protein
MSERFTTMSDEALAEAIVASAPLVDWPTTPPVARSVGASLRDPAARPVSMLPRLGAPSRRRTLIVIAAALLALAGVAVAARLAIELGAVAIDVLPGRPTALPSTATTDADLGREVAAGEAAAIAGFEPALPSLLGPPDRMWVDEARVGPEPDMVARRIVSAWGPGPAIPAIPGSETGAVLMQFEGDWQVASKLLSAETNRFAEVFVEGRPAFWTRGAHELVLVSGDEPVRLRVRGTVLIWQDAGFTFRLESDLGRAEAIRIAESVAPVVDLG